ncbi:MAG TPA: YebC/PmpR family DNA-binding transcriptional regulator [Candidatus Deferrimicrobium sp.]|nr:YebC/PmpR family DNA-binding transcriptional regulator [Candidatus Deferrimicrobium sp.]
MSGHSKWANIKHKKAKVDAQKGKVFTKLGKELIIAARQGGSDPNNNFRLKIAIQAAKSANMPNDNIQRAIQRGAGGADSANFEELTYEGYGPGGIAVMINIMTDNRNKTAGEVRHLFSKNGGNMGETGCVSWMFNSKGEIVLDRSKVSLGEDDLMMVCLEAGAEDLQLEEETAQVLTAPENLEAVRQALLDQGIEVDSAAVSLVPENTVEVTDKEQALKIIKLMDLLEDHDDVQNVYANFDIPDEIAEQL